MLVAFACDFTQSHWQYFLQSMSHSEGWTAAGCFTDEKSSPHTGNVRTWGKVSISIENINYGNRHDVKKMQIL